MSAVNICRSHLSVIVSVSKHDPADIRASPLALQVPCICYGLHTNRSRSWVQIEG